MFTRESTTIAKPLPLLTAQKFTVDARYERVTSETF